MLLDEYRVPKKTKSGIKDVNVSEFLKLIEINPDTEELNISVTLPAGSTNNVNIQLLFKALGDVLHGAHTASPPSFSWE